MEMYPYVLFSIVFFFLVLIFILPYTVKVKVNVDIEYLIRTNTLTREFAIEGLRNLNVEIPETKGISLSDLNEEEPTQPQPLPIQENLIDFLIANDNPEDVEILLEYETMEEIFKKSLKSGSLEIVKNINDKFKIDDDIESLNNCLKDNYGLNPISCILRWCCSNGRLNIVTWLIDKYKINESIVREDKSACFSQAAGSGNIELVSYLRDTFNLNRGDAEADENASVYNAIFFGHLEMLKWLITNFNLKRENIIDKECYNFITACEGSNIDLIKFLVETYNITKEEACAREYSALKKFISTQKGKDMFIWFSKEFKIEAKEIKKLIPKIFPIATIDVVVYISTKYKLNGKDITFECLEQCTRDDRDDILSFIHHKISNIETIVKNNNCFLYTYARICESKKCIEFFIKEIGVLK
jgi:hypothetical protein